MNKHITIYDNSQIGDKTWETIATAMQVSRERVTT